MPDQASAPVAPSDERTYRLPRTVIPERYELRLAPDLAAATFAGEEHVAVRVAETVEEILINAVDLDLHQVYLTNADGARIEGTVAQDSAEQRARIALAAPAEPGPWTFHCSFSGVLNDKLEGFYRSTYRDADGGEHVIATTQFEATDARRAFPCWDEPDFKAVFSVTLVVDDGLTAISNGGVTAQIRQPDGKLAVTFADTIAMSTYLVAFIVGRLEATEPVDVDGTPLRVVAVPGKGHLAAFALEIGAFSLRYFARYYGIPYPGDKLDLIALPDFASGAMENLGAVTFRETALLVDQDTASRADLERVADVVAHELAHMWFGDLVTMRWWNGLWLNEAFATFMEMLAVDAFRPDWERWTSFGLGRGAAMATDALATTRPIEFPVGRPEEAESMFDILTYEKGAGVLRMLEQYLGGDAFRRGIALYLKNHAYANAETTDLWDAIEEATGEPTRRIMDSWIFQGGFPLVTVEASANGTGLRLGQQRFRYVRDDADAALWHVPVMLRLGVEGGIDERKILLDQASTTVDLPARSGWAVANAGGHGFYRVRYAPELLRTLTSNVQQLGAVERFNLVSDTWASVVAGLTSVQDFVELTRLFREETDRNVWVALIGGLQYLHRMLEPTDRPKLHAFVRGLIGPSVERLGWERGAGEAELTSQLRGTLISAIGVLGEDPSTQARARELHQAYVSDRTAVDRDVVPAVIGIVAHTGGLGEYDLFLERSKAAPTPQEEQRYLFSLVGFRDRGLVQRTLDMTLTAEVRTQNAPYLINSLMHHLDGGDLAWAFVKTHWDTLVERFPDNTHVRMVEGITTLSTPELAADVEQFFASHAVKQGALSLAQHLERLRINLAFRQRESAALAGCF